MTVQTKKPWIETPLIESATLSKAAGCRVFLKLEGLQPSGSFKTRGIGKLILASLSDPANRNKKLHFYSSSGGNAGLAAVTAARDLGCPCTVVVPHSTKPMMIGKLRAAGAVDVLQHGASWFEADAYLRSHFIEKQQDPGVGNIYVPPFDHPEIWKGVGTLVDELATQLPPHPDRGSLFPADVIVCSVGGGGLFNGVIDGLDRYLQARDVAGVADRQSGKKIHVLAVETEGADSLALSLRCGRLQSLPAITSLATSLGALTVAPQTFKNAQSPPAGIEVTSVVGSDAEAAQGVVRVADELRLQTELAGGISFEIAVAGRLKQMIPDLTPESRVVVALCGGSAITVEMIAEYRQRLNEGWV